MLPALEKDYQQSTTIAAICVEFRNALRRAKRVLVLGHSLNDVELARALVDEVQPIERLGITHLPDSDVELGYSIRPMWTDLARASKFSVSFDSAFDGEDLGFWSDLVERFTS